MKVPKVQASVHACALASVLNRVLALMCVCAFVSYCFNCSTTVFRQQVSVSVAKSEGKTTVSSCCTCAPRLNYEVTMQQMDRQTTM